MRDEAVIWVKEIEGNSGLLPALLRRIARITEYARGMAKVWPDSSRTGLDNVRDYVGNPYMYYLETISDKHPRLRVPWEVPLVINEKGTVRIETTPFLSQVNTQLRLYGTRNLRAFFEMLEARAAWFSVMAQTALSRQAAQQAAVKAAQETTQAYDLTDSRRVRLEQIARLILDSPLPTRPYVPSRPGVPMPPTEETFRLVGKQLAEFGLCLMNHAYLSFSAEACPFPMPSGPRASCAKRAMADDLNLSALDGEIKKAYAQLFLALNISSDLGTNRLGGGVQCELSSLLDESHLGTSELGLTVKSYVDAVALFDRMDPEQQRVIPEQIGPVLGMAMHKADTARREHCAECRVAQLRGAERQAFCDNFITPGHTIYKIAAQTRAGRVSLADIAQSTMKPLNRQQFDEAGEHFASEMRHCLAAQAVTPLLGGASSTAGASVETATVPGAGQASDGERRRQPPARVTRGSRSQKAQPERPAKKDDTARKPSQAETGPSGTNSEDRDYQITQIAGKSYLVIGRFHILISKTGSRRSLLRTHRDNVRRERLPEGRCLPTAQSLNEVIDNLRSEFGGDDLSAYCQLPDGASGGMQIGVVLRKGDICQPIADSKPRVLVLEPCKRGGDTRGR
jgi:hypothetical protein